MQPGQRRAPDLSDLERTARRLGHALPALRLLVLYGSRARGEAHTGSDWDLGYLADSGFDELALRATLSAALRTDAVDVADLDRAGGLLRYRAARDGRPLFEREPGDAERFVCEAARFWLDVEPVLRAAYAHILGSLG